MFCEADPRTTPVTLWWSSALEILPLKHSLAYLLLFWTYLFALIWFFKESLQVPCDGKPTTIAPFGTWKHCASWRSTYPYNTFNSWDRSGFKSVRLLKKDFTSKYLQSLASKLCLARDMDFLWRFGILVMAIWEDLRIVVLWLRRRATFSSWTLVFIAPPKLE